MQSVLLRYWTCFSPDLWSPLVPPGRSTRTLHQRHSLPIYRRLFDSTTPTMQITRRRTAAPIASIIQAGMIGRENVCVILTLRFRISLDRQRGQVVFLWRLQRGSAALFQLLHHLPGKRSKFRRQFPATLRASLMPCNHDRLTTVAHFDRKF
jgi:hypothetical protein